MTRGYLQQERVLLWWCGPARPTGRASAASLNWHRIEVAHSDGSSFCKCSCHPKVRGRRRAACQAAEAAAAGRFRATLWSLDLPEGIQIHPDVGHMKVREGINGPATCGMLARANRLRGSFGATVASTVESVEVCQLRDSRAWTWVTLAFGEEHGRKI
jgi:hypothetical protein